MAADVLIRRCTLRLARRGGWSWGPDPQALLRAALQRLPQVIGEQVAAAWRGDSDRTVDAPLRVRFSLHVDELRALASSPLGAPPSAGEPAAVVQRLAQAVREEVLRAAGSVSAASPPQHASAPEDAPEPAGTLPEPSWAGNVLAVLSAWQRDGLLTGTLVGFGPEVLRAWHDALATAPVPAAGDDSSQAVPPAALDAVAAELAAVPLPLRAGVVIAWIRRLLLMTEAAVRFGLAPSDARVASCLQAHAGYALPDVDPDAASAAGSRQSAGTRGMQPQATPVARREVAPAPAPAPARCLRFEMAVPCALPFLLLGPLSRAGYLRTLAAVFDAAQVPCALAPAFAVALARKVLPPPRRGWLRDAGAVASAQALAGGDPGIDDAALDALGRRLAPHLAPLDATVANALERGHTHGTPLVLQSAAVGGDAGWWLCDAEGLFPIAWTDRIERLYARLAAFGELLVVPESAASPQLLRRLDEAGFGFVTDARPGRHEPWQPLAGTSLKAWTNPAAATGAALAAVATLDAWTHDSAALWQALAVARPAWPHGADAALERHLALVAALALGTIAGTLWSGREAPHPLLALERFGDFEAHVVFSDDEVRAQLPLGRRFLDLERARLLEDLTDVPWLGGRRLRFVQG